MLLLNNVCEGLLARTHYLIRFQRPPTLNEEVEKVCSKLKKKWPEFGDVEKTSGFNVFKDRTVEILASLEDFYMHIVNVGKFKVESYQLLHEISTRILEFQFELNSEIMIEFFKLFVGFSQLSLLCEYMPEVEEYTILYACAYEVSKSMSQPEWGLVQEVVKNLPNVLKELRDLCEPLGFHIGQSLRNVTDIYMRLNTVETLQSSNIFNLTLNPSTLGHAEAEPFYRNMLMAKDVKLWILFGYLICPAELQAETARDVLAKALNDGFLTPVYREFSYRILDQYSKLFEDYKQKKFKLSKFKDIVKNAINYTTAESAIEHAAVRNYLRAEGRDLLALLKEFPAILGPKIEVVLCAMQMIKEEILWYLRHRDEEPTKGKAKPRPELWVDGSISELFYLLEELNVSVRQNHREYTSLYALEFVKSKIGDVRKLYNEVSQAAMLNPLVKQMMESILQDLQSANVSSSFRRMRENWLYTSMIFSETQSGNSSRPTKALMQLMSSLVWSSKNIDDIEGQIKNYGSLHNLWYFLNPVNDIFQQSLRTPRPHWISILKVLDYSRYNIHPFCPEEQIDILHRAPRVAEEFLSIACDHFQSLFGDLVKYEKWLLAPILPMEAAMRFKGQAEGQKLEFPGWESELSSRHSIPEVRQLRRIRFNLSGLCDAARSNPVVGICDYRYCPFEFFRNTVLKAFRQELKSCFRRQANQHIERPFVFLSIVRCVFSAFENVASHINIEFHEIAKYVLLSECCDPSVGSVGQVLEPSANGPDIDENSQNPLLINSMALFYIRFLEATLSDSGILYSDIAEGFVNHKSDGRIPPGSSDVFFQSILFMHKPELEIVCQLIGPYGVRYLERQLLSTISKHVVEIKRILEQNRLVLPQISSRLTQTNIWYEGFRKLQGIDLLMHHSMRISIILKFRAMLFSAFATKVEQQMPYLTAVIQKVMQRLGDNVVDVPSFCALARDIAASDLSTDMNFLGLLKQFKLNRSDEELWNLLPEQFGYCFVSSIWERTDFVVALAAHDNNGHCVANTIITLIAGFNYIRLESDRITIQEARRRTVQHLKKFLRYASYSLLHMHAQKLNVQPDPWANYGLPAMQMFLSQFVEQAKEYVEMGDLEDTFPFTILRATNIQLTEAQTEQGRRMMTNVEEEEKKDEN